jgi:mRNA deadenylase 3'-5' endonuclease subunit Ccr4
MVGVQHWIGGLPEATFTNLPPSNEPNTLSIFNYNVLLPNSVDGWWTYKMYLPPLDDYNIDISSWEYRRSLLRKRIETVNADIVCLQEVSPLSFEDDFDFMKDLGYDGKEMFKKGRFRPATFYKRSRFELAIPAIHKDRTLLTVFRPTTTTSTVMDERNKNDHWYILNCHLQAGKQASRRLRQMNEGVKAVMTAARKLKG